MRIFWILCILILHVGTVHPQADFLADVFPLEIGERWVYGFNYHNWGVGPVIDIVDTGIIEFVILDSVKSQDSIRWILSEVKDYLHTSNYEFNSPYWVRDTFRVEILEMLDGDHLLSSNPPGYTTGFEIVPLQGTSSDSSKFHRYQLVDTAGGAKWSTTESDSSTYDVVVLKDSGIIQSTGSWSAGFLGAVTWRYFRKADSVTLGIEDTPSVPPQCVLYQNYPNPFNPSTTIRYDVVKAGLIRLKIFNVLGTSIETLVNEPLLQGAYEVEFNGGGISTGVYIYRLENGAEVHTKKFLLMK